MHEKQAAVSPVDTPYVVKTNWVINLSSRSLSDAEIALLKKGLNFAVTPVKGLSEQLRRCLQQQGICIVFKSKTTPRSQLVRPKDAVDLAKQDGVVYRIPCECGKVYISETGRPPMQDRIKEHDQDSRFARTQTSLFQSTPSTPDTTRFGMK